MDVEQRLGRIDQRFPGLPLLPFTQAGRFHAAITELLAEFAERKSPREAKMLGLPGDREPTPEELFEAAGRSRFVLFRLQA